MVSPSTRTASVVAVEDCVLRILTGETLEREVHGMKPWLATLVRTLAQRLRRREEEEAARRCFGRRVDSTVEVAEPVKANGRQQNEQCARHDGSLTR